MKGLCIYPLIYCHIRRLSGSRQRRFYHLAKVGTAAYYSILLFRFTRLESWVYQPLNHRIAYHGHSERNFRYENALGSDGFQKAFRFRKHLEKDNDYISSSLRIIDPCPSSDPLPSNTAQRNSGEHLVQHGSPNRSHPNGEYPPVVTSTKRADQTRAAVCLPRERRTCATKHGKLLHLRLGKM